MEQFLKQPHQNPHLLIGKQVDKYRITKLLGSGGFAYAYLAEDTHLLMNVVIKMLHQYLDKREREAFITEARTIAKVNHPNIIRVLNSGEYQGVLYYVMEYAPEGNLAAYVDHHGRKLSIQEVLALLYPLGQALKYFHEQTRMVHRDIKPQNLLLGRDHIGKVIVRIGDFGLTSPTSSHRIDITSNNIAGTPQYMAPEQLRGRAESRSDQYSLAVVVYELLTGTVPKALGILDTQIPPLSTYGLAESPQSQAIQTVLGKALAKEVQGRYPDEEVFMNALKEAAEKPATYPPTPLLQLARTSQEVESPPAEQQKKQLALENYMENMPRRHMIFWGTATAVVVIGGLYGLISWSAQSEQAYQRSNLLYTGHIVTKYTGHTDSVNALTWSPQGQSIASASSDHTVKIWAALTGKTSYTYKGHTDGVQAVAWSPDGKYIASGGTDKTVQVWKIDGTHIYTYPSHTQAVNALVWSPDSKRIASGSNDDSIQIWDAFSGGNPLINRVHTDDVKALALMTFLASQAVSPLAVEQVSGQAVVAVVSEDFPADHTLQASILNVARDHSHAAPIVLYLPSPKPGQVTR